MQEPNDRLDALLKQWPEVEPRPAFDQDVLRRIRLERARADSASAGFFDRLALRLTSGWGIAAAITAAVVAGFVWASTTPVPADAAVPSEDGISELLAGDSVSGSYAAMLNGGGR
jgi:hypothetical protein